MRQYETFELTFRGPVLTEHCASIDLTAIFTNDGDTITVQGFYAGEGTYKVRFLPRKPGTYTWKTTGLVEASGTESCAEEAVGHGLVQAKGTHLQFEDGMPFYSFGTTVYALVHQSEALILETMESLKQSPFNKIRLCVFPKWFMYNYVEPELFPFHRDEAGHWDPEQPDYAYWDHLESCLKQLFEMGFQVDLILFHPYDYDHWGFDRLPQKDNLTYLDYLLRRLSAFPDLWWSLANEYDVCFEKTQEDWEEIEAYVADHDPYHHLLSMHQCIVPWDHARENITHASFQTWQVNRTAAWQKQFKKPILIDECGYEGDLPYEWGCHSGRTLTELFWKTTVFGGYCTHGETFANTEDDVVFWGRGGTLRGESIARIGYLRNLIESLPGPLEPFEFGMQDAFGRSDEEIQALFEKIPEEFRAFPSKIFGMKEPDRSLYFAATVKYAGHVKDDVFLWYLDRQTSAGWEIRLPEDASYSITVIDTWNMEQEKVLEHVNGTVMVPLPRKENMAILATKES